MKYWRGWLQFFLALLVVLCFAEASSRDLTGNEVSQMMEVAMTDKPSAAQKQGQELELKFRLTRSEDFDLVVSALKAAHVATARQVNTFFDSDALDLDRNKYTVRLRKENGVFELGAKSPEIKGPGGIRTQKEEQEQKPLSPSLAEAILADRDDPLDLLVKVKPEAEALAKRIRNVLGGKKLRKVGSFVNYRETVKANLPDIGEQNLEMDTSIFPGDIVHYEIELEIPKTLESLAGDIEKAIKDLLARNGVSYKTNPPSKAKRFYRLLRGERPE